MDRFIRILLFAVIFFIIFMFFALINESCKNKATKQDRTEQTESSNLQNKVQEGANEVADEFFEDEESTDPIKENSDDVKIDQPQEETSSSLEDELFKESKPSASSSLRTTSSSSGTGESSGKYLVIAGNYLIQSNAEAMVSRLRKLGYANADYFVFDGSQYFTVSAARSNQRSAAANISNELKQRGIDSYVHTRQ